MRRGRGGGSGRGGGGRGGRGSGSGGGGRSGGGGNRPNPASRPGSSSSRQCSRPTSRSTSRSESGSSDRGARSASAGKNKPLLNGEKGAEAHTVAESDRIRFTKLLIALREDATRDKIEMPSDLTNTERKFIHQLAGQLGLKSKSTGKGEDRRITISKLLDMKKIAGQSAGGDDDGDSSLPLLNVGKGGVGALRNYIRRHPPTAVEEAESRMTGSSLIRSVMGNNGRSGNDVDDDDDGGDDVLLSPATKDKQQKEGSSGIGDDDDGDVILLRALDELNITAKTRAYQRSAPQKQVDLNRRVQMHEAAQQAKLRRPAYKKMLAARRKLPAYDFASQICDTIARNRVTILSGDTGCGKSTQVPQFLLDDPRIGPTASIIVTQPRRISAISVAERIAAERCEEAGSAGGLVGYNVRLEGASSPSTQLLFVTPGVLLRKFQSSPDLAGVTHVVIDEIHERDKYTEFLMIALRNLMTLRDDLHVVLMSATIQTHELSVYWSGVGGGSLIPATMAEGEDGESGGVVGGSGDDAFVMSDMPAEVSIPGRTFPVQEFFLEDVLEMTGFVNDDSQRFGGGATDMDQIESDLGRLLQAQAQQQMKPSQRATSSRGGRGKKKREEAAAPPIGDGTTLTCVMCNRTGFRSPEELGSHVALCDGGGGVTMEQLEEKVRGIDQAVMAGYDEGAVAAVTVDGYEDYDAVDGVEKSPTQLEDYDEDEEPGLHFGKWDGESPFGVADVVASNATTLTQEEMLNRYQSVHDDETIDDELILEIVRYISQSSYGDGAILIFFPGWGEISEFSLLLESAPPFNDRSKYSVLPLHSGIPSKEQRRVFVRPPKGVRKIVLATNIAETSITIDDVAFVVDTGRAKEKNYDPHLKTSTLQPVWVSQASAKQRRGRAGRTKAGVCFHLFSRRRHASFRPFLESELRRTPLEEMCLQCKKLGLAPGGPEDEDGIPSFLAKALTPPHPKSITNAIELLVELGAMESETNDLTDLGLCLSVLSLEPRVGKMVIWSHLLGCAKAASSMGVSMSYKSPFVLPPTSMRRAADEAKIKLSENSESDQITVLNALRTRDNFLKKGRQNAFFDYCRRNFIGVSTIQMIGDLRRNVSRELMSLGFPPAADPGYHNRNGDSDPAFLQATIAAGLYPNVASRRRGEANFSTVTNRKAKVHISSVNSCKGQPLNGKCQVREGEVEFIIFGEMVRGVASFTMSQTTHLASPLPLILLCGELRVRPAHLQGDNEVSGQRVKNSVLSVDDWILFLCNEEVAAGLVVLRKRLDSAFWHLVANSSSGLSKLSAAEKDAVEALAVVLRSAHNATPRR